GLHGVARRLDALEQAIDQRACAAARVAIDHHARQIASHGRNSITRSTTFEASIAPTEHDALGARIAVDQLQRRSEKRAIVPAGLRIKEVNSGHITLAAYG